jgi:hypothetical protein
MKLSDLAAKLGFERLTPATTGDSPEIAAGYVSDLLSDVLAHAPQGGVLVTVQVHLNVIAVAVHAELAAVIFALDRRPDDTVLVRAAEEGIALYVSKLPAFEIVGRLYAAGVRGTHA